MEPPAAASAGENTAAPGAVRVRSRRAGAAVSFQGRVVHKRNHGADWCYIDVMGLWSGGSDEPDVMSIIELALSFGCTDALGPLGRATSLHALPGAEKDAKREVMSVLRAGDVIWVRGVVGEEAPNAPRSAIVLVDDFQMRESWLSVFGPSSTQATSAEGHPQDASAADEESGDLQKRAQETVSRSEGPADAKPAKGPKLDRNRIAFIQPVLPYAMAATRFPDFAFRRNAKQQRSAYGDHATDVSLDRIFGLNRSKAGWQLPAVPRAATEPVAADRFPIAALQCQTPFADRLAAYLHGVVASQCTRDRLVLLFEIRPGEFGADGAQDMALVERRRAALLGDSAPAHFQGTVQRIFLFPRDAVESRIMLTFAEVVEAYRARAAASRASATASGAEVLRVRRPVCFPRFLEDKLRAQLPEEFDLQGRPLDVARVNAGDAATGPGIQHVFDSFVYVDGMYLAAYDVPRVVVPEKTSAVPSSAYWKMLEVVDRYRVDQPGLSDSSTESYVSANFSFAGDRGGARAGAELQPQPVAIDIGASPGGWTYCLAKELNAPRIIAVDPARHMHESVMELIRATSDAGSDGGDPPHRPHVEHWRMRGDEALERLAAGDASRVSICVCDMNVEPEQTVSMAEELIRRGLAAPKCLLVLTFKNTCRSKVDYVQRRDLCIARLEKAGVKGIELLHLFANTPMEMTVVGEVEGGRRECSHAG